MTEERTIWKYPIMLNDEVVLSLPVGSEVLSVGPQQGLLYVWVAVTPGSKTEDRTIYIRGTGHAMGQAASCRFIGTVVMAGGSLASHFFDGGIRA